jgi:hypothetical protein
MSRCFSLVCEGDEVARLDVEASSTKARNDWVLGLVALLKSHGTRLTVHKIHK